VGRRNGAGLVGDVQTLDLEPEDVGVGHLAVSAGPDGMAGDEAEVGSGLVGAGSGVQLGFRG